jgi:magnesium chelatase subunit I
MADVKGLNNPQERVEVMLRREDFSKDPDAFISKFDKETKALKIKILKARDMLPSVKISEEILATIARVAVEFGVDGHRADIIMERTARTAAAFEGRTTVERTDLVTACELALPHRMRRQPFEEGEFSSAQLLKLIERYEKGG